MDSAEWGTGTKYEPAAAGKDARALQDESDPFPAKAWGSPAR